MCSVIPLSKGQVAIIDAADFNWLSQWKWTAQFNGRGFYAIRKNRGVLVMMHRLINQTPDGMVTDHIDGNGLNNRRSNLRSATQLQNMMNRQGKAGGTSRYKGVWLDGSRWRSAIRINGKLLYLGRFDTEEEAADAYLRAAKMHFGEFANTSKREGSTEWT